MFGLAHDIFVVSEINYNHFSIKKQKPALLYSGASGHMVKYDRFSYFSTVRSNHSDEAFEIRQYMWALAARLFNKYQTALCWLLLP